MSVIEVIGRLRQFDAYPKTLHDFRVKTFGGATVTMISGILICILFISELNYYLTKEIEPELFVDTTKEQKLRINIDLKFPHVGCSFLSIDAMDMLGDKQFDVDHNIFKLRLNQSGSVIEEAPVKENLADDSGEVLKNVATTLDPQRCESCYGAESSFLRCCNTCEDVKEAYRKKGWAFHQALEIEQCKRDGTSFNKMMQQKNEGCRIYGYLEVNKVAGNFHIVPGRSFQQDHIHVHEIQPLSGQKFNLTHHIKQLSFGMDYPGQVNPLDKTIQITDKDTTMFQYFLKIVPTTYVKLNGDILSTNQFSVTKHKKVISGGLFGDQGLPGVFFTYELSPMMVKYTEKQRSFMHFLTGVCAVIGGIFTVAGLIDTFIYHSSRVVQQRIELRKST